MIANATTPVSELFEGERPDTTYLTDAQLWIDVYSQLIDSLCLWLNDDTAGESLPRIAHMAGRYRLRLDFWMHRGFELRTLDTHHPRAGLDSLLRLMG